MKAVPLTLFVAVLAFVLAFVTGLNLAWHIGELRTDFRNLNDRVERLEGKQK